MPITRFADRAAGSAGDEAHDRATRSLCLASLSMVQAYRILWRTIA
jgi:hypothetical protein